MNGEIEYEESLKKRVSLLEGITKEQVRRVAENLPLVDGAEKIVEGMKSDGFVTAVITGSFSIIAERIAEKLNIDYVKSNELVFEDGIATGEVKGPLTEDDSKGKVLKKLLSELKISNSKCIVIGDGANDLSMFKIAGFSVAFNGSNILKKESNLIINNKDLKKVLFKIRDNVCWNGY